MVSDSKSGDFYVLETAVYCVLTVTICLEMWCIIAIIIQCIDYVVRCVSEPLAKLF